MIAIIVAMPIEAEYFLATSKIKKTIHYGFTKIYELSYAKKDYLLAISGVGKIYASLMVSNLFHIYQNKLEGIINVGCAGSLNEKEAPILSAIIASKVALHDYDLSALGAKRGEIDELKQIYFKCNQKINKKLIIAAKNHSVLTSEGIISSGDTFIAIEEEKQKIRSLLGSLAVDMEAGAIGEAASLFSIPFAVLRLISDCNSNALEYSKNRDKASHLASEIALEFIRQF